MREILAKDLRAGHLFSSGNSVYMSACELTTTPKGKVTIGIEYPSGVRSEVNWNKYTKIKVLN